LGKITASLIFIYIESIQLTVPERLSTVTHAMANAGLSELRLAYKKAVYDWVQAIRAEEALATSDHSITAMEKWDAAHFKEQDGQTKATEAREAYKDGLRGVDYGI
jgi:ABC-type transport system involved in cytochrome bd biosynthesis fused ATPase/permease subunit